MGLMEHASAVNFIGGGLKEKAKIRSRNRNGAAIWGNRAL